jgi:hypothetical protein
MLPADIEQDNVSVNQLVFYDGIIQSHPDSPSLPMDMRRRKRPGQVRERDCLVAREIPVEIAGDEAVHE